MFSFEIIICSPHPLSSKVQKQRGGANDGGDEDLQFMEGSGDFAFVNGFFKWENDRDMIGKSFKIWKNCEKHL